MEATSSRGVSFNVRKILRKCRHDVDIYVRLWATYAFCRPPRRKPTERQSEFDAYLAFLATLLEARFQLFLVSHGIGYQYLLCDVVAGRDGHDCAGARRLAGGPKSWL